MEISCSKSVLDRAIQKTQRAVIQRTSVPALTGLLLEAVDGKLSITGYDLEIGVTCVIDADIITEGACIITAREFASIIRSLPDEEVKISVNDNMAATITCGQSEFSSIAVYEAEDFPALPTVEDSNVLKIKKSQLKNLIRKTSFAAAQTQATERERVLCGAYFEFDGEILTVAATDKFRIALCREKLEPQAPVEFLVPNKALSELSRLVDDSDDDITIQVTRRHLQIQDDDVTIISRLIEGEFINYERAIPKDPPIVVTVDTAELLSKVEGARVLISDKQINPLILDFDFDSLELHTATASGRFEARVAVEGSRQKLRIGFNGRLLSEALSSCEYEKIKLELTSPLMPCAIRPLEGDEFLHLLLPVRLGEAK